MAALSFCYRCCDLYQATLQIIAEPLQIQERGDLWFIKCTIQHIQIATRNIYLYIQIEYIAYFCETFSYSGSKDTAARVAMTQQMNWPETGR